jgi:hypothetical protein
MKQGTHGPDDEALPEYDSSQGVRGKHHAEPSKQVHERTCRILGANEPVVRPGR